MPEWMIPGYTGRRVLGSGGSGDVVLAKEDNSGIVVAVKYLRDDLPGAAGIVPGMGRLAGEDGGLVAVHGLAAFAWDAGGRGGPSAGRGVACAAAGRVAGPGGGGVRGGPGHHLAVGSGAGLRRGGLAWR